MNQENNKEIINDTNKEILPPVKKVNKSSTTSMNKIDRKKSPSKTISKVSIIEPRQHLIIGKHINSESGFSFACSESSSFREILVDFAKTIDISLNKTRSTLFADVLANLTDKNDNVKMAFLLLEEMFGYKVLFISEVSNLYYGKDFIEKLKKKMNDTNEPLPF